MRLVRLSAAIILVVLTVSVYSSQIVVQEANAQIQVKREVTIPVKVVLVGIDPTIVDTSYIKWNFNLPIRTYEQILYPQPSLTGVVYRIDYSFTFADDEFKSKLISYLKSIEENKSGQNPWFYYYTGEASGYVRSDNYYTLNYSVYNASRVEDWLYGHRQELGGFPDNGWTLMFLNLPELPSFDFQDYKDFLKESRQSEPSGTAHYYSVTYVDSDLGYRLRFRDYMTGWGGVHRFWFNDLSAGPSFWTGLEDIPLQVILKDNRIDLGTPFGKTWFTEYFSDYIWQATWNLVTPFFIYAPDYSQKYSFNVHVFDNRTLQERREVDIRKTINLDPIKRAFQDLLPYSQVEVAITFEDMARYPELTKVIRSNYKFTDSFTFGVYGQPLQFGIVDARPVYKYLQDNFKTFEPNFRHDRSEFMVPVFAFAFSKDTLFTFSYKWLIAKAESGIKALLGVALGDLALVSLSQRQFQRGTYVTPIQLNKGYGFTEVVIHEAGHMVGLPHPHAFGDIGDFTLSAMGYFTWDYVFGQSDKDALQRTHVDQSYMRVQSLLEQLSQSNAETSDVNAIRNQLRDVDGKYSRMDYAAALKSALKAEDMAKAVLGGASILPGGIVAPKGVARIVIVLSGVAIGLLVGVLVSWLVLRKGVASARPKRRPARRRRRSK